MLFSEADSKPTESASAQYARPHRRTLAENDIYIDDSQSTTTPQETSYNPSRQALMANPLDGVVSIASSRPAWSPTHGISATALSHGPSSSSSSSVPTAASPLERGTEISTFPRQRTSRPREVPEQRTYDADQGEVPEQLRICINSNDRSRSSDGKSSNRPSSSSLLATKLNSAGSSSSLSGSANGSTRIMQRAMTFDTLHSVATTAVGATSTITKTVKTPERDSSFLEDGQQWEQHE
ncbi:hypothetical protein EDD21DRAFT_409636 [Dissophora ornata]|nr:hypothetical protein EDD21DRAFT_409636 [Dissophora ornata]